MMTNILAPPAMTGAHQWATSVANFQRQTRTNRNPAIQQRGTPLNC